MLVTAILCAVLAVYVAGYLSHDLVVWQVGANRQAAYRQVTTEWEATLYVPAAWGESQIRERRIALLPPSRWWQVAPEKITE
jgi:hypothetical protein